jgi:hypothetical protein
MSKDQRYNGWKNHDTWNIALWFGNEEALYRSVAEHQRPFTTQSARRLVMETFPEGTPDMRQLPGRKYAGVSFAEIRDDFNSMREGA